MQAEIKGSTSGDGLHLVALTGPGRVWLQSMPVPVLAHALARTWAAARPSRSPAASRAAPWATSSAANRVRRAV